MTVWLQAMAQFVAGKLGGYPDQPDGSKSRLPLEILALHLRVLQSHCQAGPADFAAEVSQLQHHALRVHPELQVLIVEAAAAASATPAPTASFPVDIEEEANLYFQKVTSMQVQSHVLSALRLCSSRSTVVFQFTVLQCKAIVYLSIPMLLQMIWLTISFCNPNIRNPHHWLLADEK